MTTAVAVMTTWPTPLLVLSCWPTKRKPRHLINGRLLLPNGYPDWSPAGDPTGKGDAADRLRIQVVRLSEKEALEQGLPRWK